MAARFTLALTLALIAGASVHAKPLSRIIAEMGLSPADFEVVSATANSLLSSGAPSAGKEKAWSNADTGSKGTVRIQSVQGNCVQLQHVVQPAGAESARDIRTRRCNDGSGNWILTP